VEQLSANSLTSHIDNIFNARSDDIGFNIILSNNNTFITQASIQGNITRICDGNDYESWFINKDCLNGEIATYISKKEDSKCAHPDFYDTIFRNIKTQCNCTEEDFECDFNFVRQNHSCVNINPHYYDPPFFCQGYYSLYNGVRKIDGNKCVVTDSFREYNVTTFICPNFFSLNSYSISSIIIVFLVIIAILIYFIRKCLMSKNPVQQEKDKTYESVTSRIDNDVNFENNV
jgi:hypothetical protein